MASKSNTVASLQYLEISPFFIQKYFKLNCLQEKALFVSLIEKEQKKIITREYRIRYREGRDF
jgi:hypothetical protein